MVTEFFVQNRNGLSIARAFQPIGVEINRVVAAGIGAGCPRHGAARHDLNGGKISCLTLREPIGDALQLGRRLAWLQPQCINAC